MTVGKLTRVALRMVWKHEAVGFTTWLEQNTDVLNEVLDSSLVSAEREKSAGDFNVDVVGEDEDGKTVILEDQLERSDHDHLGKALTELAVLDAKPAVWIVARPRPEHVKAASWLNEAPSTPFYLVQVEAVRIGASPRHPCSPVLWAPAPKPGQPGRRRRTSPSGTTLGIASGPNPWRGRKRRLGFMPESRPGPATGLAPGVASEASPGITQSASTTRRWKSPLKGVMRERMQTSSSNCESTRKQWKRPSVQNSNGTAPKENVLAEAGVGWNQEAGVRRRGGPKSSTPPWTQ